MKHDLEIPERYGSELAALEVLDRAYYAKKEATTTERAAYAARQEQRESIRARLYAELTTNQPSKPQARIVVSTRADGPPATPPSARPPCRLTHDLRNLMGVVLWRCETLLQDVPSETQEAEQAAKLLDVVKKIVRRLHEPCSLEAAHHT